MFTQNYELIKENMGRFYVKNKIWSLLQLLNYNYISYRLFILNFKKIEYY